MSQEQTIEAQATKLLAQKVRENLSPQTVAYYRRTVQEMFVPWALANGLSDGSLATVEHWNAYVDELQGRRRRGRKLSTHSVLTYLRGARIFLKFLKVDLEEFAEPKAPELLLEALTRREIDQLETAATNERDKLIVRVLANTGIRLSELTGLQPKDLKEFMAPKRRCRLRVLGKGSKTREVAIDPETFQRLKAFAQLGGERPYVFPAQWGSSGGMWETQGKNGQSQPLSNNAVDTMFRKLRADAGIEPRSLPAGQKARCTPHKLRHAFATWALQNGWTHEELRLQLGHADYNMIIKVYAHMTPDDVSRAYERTFGEIQQTEEPRKRRRIAV